MLAEYALVPDIFDGTCYSSPGVCDVHLSQLKSVLLEEALVRDLYDGQWSACVKDGAGRWHQRAKELHKKLILQKRLRSAPAAHPSVPMTGRDWCAEAIASHHVEPLNGVIATSDIATEFPGESVVTSIERLASARWWQDRKPSVRLRRRTSDYLKHLRLVLKNANSLMFIDPHLDPSRQRYGEFVTLLQSASRQALQPQIEIHRVCYEGSGKDRQFPDWQQIFLAELDGPLRDAGLTAKVFIWDDFHDRYLITNLIGISLPRGFDVSIKQDDRTTWLRLGRDDRDDVQREFDPAAGRHKLHKPPFTVGSPL